MRWQTRISFACIAFNVVEILLSHSNKNKFSRSWSVVTVQSIKEDPKNKNAMEVS